MTTVRDPLERVLGARTAKVLHDAFDMETAGDLLRHYPRRYASRGELTELSSLQEGEHVTVLAKVATVRKIPMGGRRGDRLEVIVTDGTARLTLMFFHKAGYWQKLLRQEGLGLFAGTVSSFRGKRQLVHPDCEMLPTAATASGQATEYAAGYAAELIPVYPASAKISSWQIARSVRTVLDTLDVTEDPLPEQLRGQHELTSLSEAIHGVHRPENADDYRQARRRLKWDEAFVLQAALAQRRHAAAALPATPRPLLSGGLAEAFDRRLPFSLTAGQCSAGETISADLACAFPMHRLLQGEVGSGKTVIAVRAMLQVIDAGGQAALLAPTEVLAQQHHRSISAMLGPLGQAGRLGAADTATRVALLTGSMGTAARREALTDVFTGDAGIVIGTHALLEDKVRFSDLGLVVIDEQHRFGVEQRDALREKAAGGRPHVLVMTATPIPRTVAMTVYGDLETSTLTELPAGRSPIASHVVPADKPHFLDRAWTRIREEVSQGRQAYVVCPRVGSDDAGSDDEGEEPPEDSAEETTSRRPPLAVLDVAPALEEGPLNGLRVAVLHGRMPADDKERTMRAFTEGHLDVLVATTVIEVGVDVPNATVMVVMDADRFGVSQLHQLRGRVGRGREPGLCLLVTEAEAGSPARERLDAVAATLDGFSLSRLDLEQRREGDVLGATQAGRRSSLKLLSLLADEDLIRQAREEAAAVVAEDPGLTSHQPLAEAIADLLGPQRAEFLDKT
ncbi:MAG TPA: ATP-dependent DNA helicase RecG [Streptosporangiaceae bacterium]|jgi:ATP-dependent DNA helicase RecG|nr:ATP-dependent DNA helicase RecG [Streptosporangiaceae bacterium]